ncbi:hypothetical protein PVAP13_2NG531903 [Panicum virgatum]|uniref:Uncharacterized protein n=1 Tax=Panicum virgatum TaxID=38727 RepID=A0A8T0VVI3_PANVG|nr:hypothetical protein PVAP13_2NG531903 [Panicum virgatum]
MAYIPFFLSSPARSVCLRYAPMAPSRSGAMAKASASASSRASPWARRRRRSSTAQLRRPPPAGCRPSSEPSGASRRGATAPRCPSRRCSVGTGPLGSTGASPAPPARSGSSSSSTRLS